MRPGSGLNIRLWCPQYYCIAVFGPQTRWCMNDEDDHAVHPNWCQVCGLELVMLVVKGGDGWFHPFKQKDYYLPDWQRARRRQDVRNNTQNSLVHSPELKPKELTGFRRKWRQTDTSLALGLLVEIIVSFLWRRHFYSTSQTKIRIMANYWPFDLL